MEHSYSTRSKSPIKSTRGKKRSFTKTYKSTSSQSGSNSGNILDSTKYRNLVWKWSCSCKGKKWDNGEVNRSWVCDELSCNNCECEICLRNLGYDDEYIESIHTNRRNFFCIKHRIKRSIDTNTNNKMNYYVTVGLNSNIKVSDFKRKKMNLVICLDKSGSMTDTFNFSDHINTKMKIAKESLINLLKHLNNEDQFGMIVFDEKAQCIQPLSLWKDINYNKLKENILNINASGGTNFENGYCDAIKLYEKYLKGEYCSDEYENRIIFLTDACPNAGNINPYSLLSMVKTNANNKQRIYTTFIGVGLDFNANLIEIVSRTRGCNYYTVKSSDDFM
eukprot:216099_1